MTGDSTLARRDVLQVLLPEGEHDFSALPRLARLVNEEILDRSDFRLLIVCPPEASFDSSSTARGLVLQIFKEIIRRKLTCRIAFVGPTTWLSALEKLTGFKPLKSGTSLFPTVEAAMRELDSWVVFTAPASISRPEPSSIQKSDSHEVTCPHCGGHFVPKG